MSTLTENKKSDANTTKSRKGIYVDFETTSIEGDRTHAVILSYIRRNEKGELEVLVYDHEDNTNTVSKKTTVRLPAGSSIEKETVYGTIFRKTKEVVGLVPSYMGLVGLSETPLPTSARFKDTSREKEVHTKYAFLVVKYDGEMITSKPAGGETSIPRWLNVVVAKNMLFYSHRAVLTSAVEVFEAIEASKKS